MSAVASTEPRCSALLLDVAISGNDFFSLLLPARLPAPHSSEHRTLTDSQRTGQKGCILAQVTARFAAANAAGVSRLLFTSGTVLATGEPCVHGDPCSAPCVLYAAPGLTHCVPAGFMLGPWHKDVCAVAAAAVWFRSGRVVAAQCLARPRCIVTITRPTHPVMPRAYCLPLQPCAFMHGGPRYGSPRSRFAIPVSCNNAGRGIETHLHQQRTTA